MRGYIVSSQTLGMALGDWIAERTDLGYGGGPLAFLRLMAVVVVSDY